MKHLPILAAAGLFACASAPTLQHYHLPALNQAPTVDVGASTRLLSLLPVSLARHIDRQGLLYQGSDIEISEAHGHRWAEPLEDQLGRALRLQLGRQMPGVKVLPARSLGPLDGVTQQLLVHVERFQGRYDGVAVLSGYWLLRDASGRLLANGDFSLERALEADGYPALVNSLDAAWTQVGAELARALREHS